MRFLADGMLGKLTRWLRMLGHDVEYYRLLEDAEFIDKAKKENRILLTRDRQLFQRAMTQGATACLVEGTTEVEKLAQLSKRFSFKLNVDVAVSRCPKCNTPVTPVSKEDVADRIPRATSLRYNEFWRCPGCRQIYWRGGHWHRIKETLKRAGDARTSTHQC